MDSASDIKIELTKEEIKALLVGLPVWSMNEERAYEGRILINEYTKAFNKQN